jgi:hypothetical protein
MPQESRTADLIARHQAGVLLRHVREVVPLVRRLTHDRAELESMRRAASRLAVPNATQRIVQELLQKVEGPIVAHPLSPLPAPVGPATALESSPGGFHG